MSRAPSPSLCALIVAVVVASTTGARAHAPPSTTTSTSTSTTSTTGSTPSDSPLGQTEVTAFRARMDAMAAALTAILPDATSAGPVDAARAARLKAGLVTLKAASHDLSSSRGAGLPDGDPTLNVVLDELRGAVDDVANSAPDRLPQATLAMVSACIACHTRMPARSASFAMAKVDDEVDADVRADIYAATRRFDDARVAYRAVVFDEAFAAAEPWRYERAVRRALAVEVRVKGDLKAARALTEQVLATPGAEGLWPAAAAWKTSLGQWRSDVADGDDSALDDTGRLAMAARLMNRALEGGSLLGDASADIDLLRATALLHQLLASRTGVLASMRAQALSWLGVAYERLNDLDIWGLSMFYDDAAIVALPHSPLARACLARYERNARELFSGNSGAALPAPIAARLKVLQALSAPK